MLAAAPTGGALESASIDSRRSLMAEETTLRDEDVRTEQSWSDPRAEVADVDGDDQDTSDSDSDDTDSDSDGTDA
jgi:hypothetical protein